MEELKTLIKDVIQGLSTESERFVVIDNLHIHDTQSGLKFHMYDHPDPFHMTVYETGEEVAHMDDFLGLPEIMLLFGELKDTLTSVHKSQAAAKKIKATANRTNLVTIYNRKP